MHVEECEYRPLPGMTFRLSGHDDDVSVFQEIQRSGTWEPHLAPVIERCVSRDSICFDVGANIGAFSVLMARLARDGRVFCFEAVKETAAVLQQNLDRNAATNATVVTAAVSSEAGTVRMHEPKGWLGTSFVLAGGGDTPAITLDEFARDNGISRVDFIKMDTEGAELPAMNGAWSLIRSHRPVLLIEYNPITMDRDGRDRRALYDALAECFPSISVIGRWNTPEQGTIELTPIHNWGELAALMPEGQIIWQDLLCEFSG
jgi:FkbM family methyltransferase